MTEIAAPSDSSALVPGVHRRVRTVDGGEGPFSGALVVYEDSVAVCIDTQELSEWGGWAYSDTEHVCGILDVRRRRDGHDALLPWCTQRVETFLGRRRAANALLAPGELATLTASFLRGLRELGDAASDGIGDWWLTGDGRPLFVHGDGGAARSRTGGLVERLTAHTNDRATLRILDEMQSALRERRHHHDDDVRWEGELFAIAAPRALRTDIFAPEKASDVQSRRALRPGTEMRRPLRRSLRESRTSQRAWRKLLTTLRGLAGSSHDGAMSLLHRRTEGKPRGAAATPRTGPPPTRKRALIVAGALAGLVLVVGLMWPEGQDPEAAQASQSTPKSTPDAEVPPPAAEEQGGAETEEPQEEPSPAVEEQALDAVPAMLQSIAACAEARLESCPQALSAGVAVPAAGPVSHGPDGSTAELVDDYGDVAVVRLTPIDANAESSGQILVLERDRQKWLVRDIYDVAHQPD
ncbi:hypothetical protein ACTU6U_06725 [Microbacterium sp. A196]|uniref:hypothetical protein n=1 Tax=Microbacterium sp. A196 TaxID=3457320 RepID=UPI003FD2DCF0